MLIPSIFWVFLKHPSAKPPLTSKAIALQAKKEALHQLKLLSNKNLPEKGFFDEFYVDLTTPVRAYLERRYNIPVSSRTTPEFLAEAAQDPAFPSALREQLKLFLDQADQVKFGRYRPTVVECETAQKLAIKFIEADSTSL